MNFHYLFPVAQSVKLYPLFGLTMSNWMFDMHDLDVDWDGDHVHVDDGGNHNEFRIGLISEPGRNSLWDVTGL